MSRFQLHVQKWWFGYFVIHFEDDEKMKLQESGNFGSKDMKYFVTCESWAILSFHELTTVHANEVPSK